MKIANMVIFHKNPGSIERLLKTINHPAFDFYLHLDKKVNITPFVHLSQIPRTRFVSKRINVRWAGFSQVEAFLSCMDDIIKSGIEYDFVNLLSGQDYPIKPIDTIPRYLSNYKDKSFMICEPAPSLWWNGAINRVSNYYFDDYGFPGKHRLGMALSGLLPSRKFPLPFTLYGGPFAAYWILSMKAACFVHRFLAKNTQYRWYFKHTWGSDEFLIHTLLMNSEFKDSIIPENYHYIDRSLGKTKPKILTVADLPSLKNSNKFFARKFDPAVDSMVLDQIDEEILFKVSG